MALTFHILFISFFIKVSNSSRECGYVGNYVLADSRDVYGPSYFGDSHPHYPHPCLFVENNDRHTPNYRSRIPKLRTTTLRGYPHNVGFIHNSIVVIHMLPDIC